MIPGRPLCSVSLDLDNLWTYLKTHGDEGWQAYPSYLGIVVPRVLGLLEEFQWSITWFLVGHDAALAPDRQVLAQIPQAGHEVGNHSFHHEPWLHLYSEEAIEAELSETENAIEAVTGQRPEGFRGPGFSFSPTLLQVLARRGYRYDASTFPTFLGPLARWYYFATAKNLSPEDKAKRSQLFGRWSEGLRPLKPYHWSTAAGPLLEIPVTTMPVFKLPIHLSYLLYLDGYSRAVARAYLALAVSLCRIFRVEPSFLLHPLDFLGADDTNRLSFFPAMQRSHPEKLAFVRIVFATFSRSFQCVPMGVHATAIAARQAKTRVEAPLVPG